MKNYFKIALISLGLLSMFSCEDDDDNKLPSAAKLTAPANDAKDMDVKPAFSWENSIDPDNDMLTYDLYVAETKDFLEEDKKAKGINTNSFTLTKALKPHTQYFWKVVADDDNGGTAESAVWSFTTKNTAPTVSGLEFPINEATDVEKSISLKWSAEDLDGDALKYNIYLGKAEALEEADIVAKEITETEYAVELDGHTQYFWKVVAVDTEGESVSSDVASFTTMNTLPSKVELKTPANEHTGVVKTVKISWSEATDADNDAVTYSIYYGTNKEINENFPYKKDLTVTEFTLNNLRGNATYYWKIVAMDSEGGKTSSDVFSFSTDNTPPTAAVLSDEITESIKDDKLNIEFSWTASTDPDKKKDSEGKLQPEKLVYDLYISNDDSFEAADLKKADIEELKYVVEGLEFETAYYAMIKTKDETGAVVESNVINFTTRSSETGITEGTWTDARDGKVYKTVTINGKTWLAENYAYLPFFVDPDNDENKCSVYGLPIVAGFGQSDFVMPTVAEAKAHENYAKYGVMYSAYYLDDIAPDGWHVATDEEWKELERFSGMKEDDVDYTGYRGNTTHKFLSTTWNSTPEATNELKFNAVPGGYNKTVEDKGEGSYTYFWTNSYKTNMFTGSKSYWNRALSGSKAGVNRGSTKPSTYRMYIRLVKDND
jgi:uncharacterized protein (TIGR02145 family)